MGVGVGANVGACNITNLPLSARVVYGRWTGHETKNHRHPRPPPTPTPSTNPRAPSTLSTHTLHPHPQSSILQYLILRGVDLRSKDFQLGYRQARRQLLDWLQAEVRAHRTFVTVVLGCGVGGTCERSLTKEMATQWHRLGRLSGGPNENQVGVRREAHGCRRCHPCRRTAHGTAPIQSSRRPQPRFATPQTRDTYNTYNTATTAAPQAARRRDDGRAHAHRRVRLAPRGGDKAPAPRQGRSLRCLCGIIRGLGIEWSSVRPLLLLGLGCGCVRVAVGDCGDRKLRTWLRLRVVTASGRVHGWV